MPRRAHNYRHFPGRHHTSWKRVKTGALQLQHVEYRNTATDAPHMLLGLSMYLSRESNFLKTRKQQKKKTLSCSHAFEHRSIQCQRAVLPVTSAAATECSCSLIGIRYGLSRCSVMHIMRETRHRLTPVSSSVTWLSSRCSSNRPSTLHIHHSTSYLRAGHSFNAYFLSGDLLISFLCYSSFRSRSHIMFWNSDGLVHRSGRRNTLWVSYFFERTFALISTATGRTYERLRQICNAECESRCSF